MRFAERVNDLYRLDLKRLLAVLGKHAADRVEYNLGFGHVCSCALDEHVTSRDSHLCQVDGDEASSDLHVQSRLVTR